MAVKVSVVVPTYNSGSALLALVASLDRQSLPADQFEVIAVDDGSTDDTWPRLQQLAAARRNMYAHRIAASGWPGRPRNVGTDRAIGEYVLFMDHDDELFPESLERWYDYGATNRSDVVIGKEVTFGSGSVAWSTFTRQVARVEHLDEAALALLTPHKLYRRAFLVESGVRFPEGRVRLEDYVVNYELYARGAAISILSDYPCYRWITHAKNNTKSSYDQDMWWDMFRRCVEIAEHAQLSRTDKDELLLRLYQRRVLPRVGIGFHRRPPPTQHEIMRRYGPATARLFPVALDERLSSAERSRACLLRAGDADRLVRLSEEEAGIRAVAELIGGRWVGGAFAVEVDLILSDSHGRPLALRRVGDRLMRALPSDLTDALPESALDVTAELEDVGAELTVRSRALGTEWIVPGPVDVTVEERAGVLTVRARLSATIDPATAAFERALDEDVWTVWARMSPFGLPRTRQVAAPASMPTTVGMGKPIAVAYATAAGNLALDLTAAATQRLDAAPRPAVGATVPLVRMPAGHDGSATPRESTAGVGDVAARDQHRPLRLAWRHVPGPVRIRLRRGFVRLRSAIQEATPRGNNPRR